MVDDNNPKGIFVEAHYVPAPATVSPQAQAFLSQRMAAIGPLPPEDLTDKNGWREYLAMSNQWLLEGMKMGAAAFPAEIITHERPRSPVYEIVPQTPAPEMQGAALLYIHGGAYMQGSGLAGAYMAMPLACVAGVATFAVDYRMPVDHPFPTGLDDCVDAYRWLLESYEPKKIAIAGGSAGGGLAAALTLKIRDMGLPMPGAVVLATPESDLTESGDSFETNIHVDVVMTKRLTDSIALYANGHDLRDPYLSPFFGDFTKGFPPTFLNCGTRDVFLSNTVLLHRKLRRAGIPAELHVWEGMPHGGFFGAPEDLEVFEEQARFIKEQLAG